MMEQDWSGAGTDRAQVALVAKKEVEALLEKMNMKLLLPEAQVSPLKVETSGITPTLGMLRRRSVADALSDPACLSPLSPLSPASPMTDSSNLSPRRASFSGIQMDKDKAAVPRFDELTIRQWFNCIDTDGNGCLDKQEWLDFLRANPKLKKLILRGCDAIGLVDQKVSQSFLQGKEDAREMRRLLKIWKEIDTDGSGTLEWAEFVDFFRRTGNLLEYRNPNPKQRMAEIVGEINESNDPVPDEAVAEFDELAARHLGGERRRSLETEFIKRIDSDGEAACRIRRRHSTQFGESTVSPRRRSSLGISSEMPKVIGI